MMSLNQHVAASRKSAYAFAAVRLLCGCGEEVAETPSFAKIECGRHRARVETAVRRDLVNDAAGFRCQPAKHRIACCL